MARRNIIFKSLTSQPSRQDSTNLAWHGVGLYKSQHMCFTQTHIFFSWMCFMYITISQSWLFCIMCGVWCLVLLSDSSTLWMTCTPNRRIQKASLPGTLTCSGSVFKIKLHNGVVCVAYNMHWESICAVWWYVEVLVKSIIWGNSQ